MGRRAAANATLKKRSQTVRDRYLQTIGHAMIAIAFLLGFIALSLWVKTDGLESTAQAAAASRPDTDGSSVLDAGKQRLETLDQLKEMNRHLATLEAGFRDGTFSVQTPDIKAAAKAAAAARDEGKAGR
jgi:hypothetical protein